MHKRNPQQDSPKSEPSLNFSNSWYTTQHRQKKCVQGYMKMEPKIQNNTPSFVKFTTIHGTFFRY